MKTVSELRQYLLDLKVLDALAGEPLRGWQEAHRFREAEAHVVDVLRSVAGLRLPLGMFPQWVVADMDPTAVDSLVRVENATSYYVCLQPLCRPVARFTLDTRTIVEAIENGTVVEAG